MGGAGGIDGWVGQMARVREAVAKVAAMTVVFAMALLPRMAESRFTEPKVSHVPNALCGFGHGESSGSMRDFSHESKAPCVSNSLRGLEHNESGDMSTSVRLQNVEPQICQNSLCGFGNVFVWV